MSVIPSAEYASLAREALSPRLVLVPAECPAQPEAPLYDESMEPDDFHIGGCLRGVFFALILQSAAITFCLFLFAMWRLLRS